MTFKRACSVVMALGFLAGPAMADQLTLTGVIRDFKRGDRTGGHPDFETAHMSGRGGYGHVTGLVAPMIGQDGKPVYNPTRPSQDTIYSAASLAQWFTDVIDVNTAAALDLTLDNGQDAPGGVYTYQSNSFFPADGLMFGNEGLNHNFHFTFELHTTFTYQSGQVFTFIGDDDVWVYVNGVQVIDLGGVHPAVTGSVLLFDGKAFVENEDFSTGGMVQTVDTALAQALAGRWAEQGLEGSCPVEVGDKYINLGVSDGDACTLDFFFAERHTTQSNFRIDTTIELVDVEPTSVSPLYD